MTDSQLTAEPAAIESPVSRDISRSISAPTTLRLFAESGGFCQFDGCDLSLIEHHVTQRAGNFADKAHIVAFKDGGTRGDPTVDNAYINSPENLMLLCKGCHKLIDDNGALYSRRMLEDMKQARIDLVRSAVRTRAGELKTHVIVFEAPIGGRNVSVANHEIVAGVRPRYPIRSNPLRMPLNDLASLGETAAYYQAAAELIDTKMTEYLANGGALFNATHASVFAIGPIPLLVKLGAALNDKVPVQIHHKRNNPATWEWNSEGDTLKFGLRTVRQGTADGAVGLAISISGAVPTGDLDGTLGADASIYEIYLENRPPARTALQKQADLEAFKDAYSTALGVIAENHGVSTRVHLLPAVPAAVAVACGLMRHPKAHGPLKIYDFREGAYKPILEIGT